MNTTELEQAAREYASKAPPYLRDSVMQDFKSGALWAEERAQLKQHEGVVVESLHFCRNCFRQSGRTGEQCPSCGVTF